MSTTEPKAGEWWWCEVATMLGALALMRMDSGDWRDRGGIFSEHCVRPLARIPDPPAPEPTEAEKIDARRAQVWRDWNASDVERSPERLARMIRESDEVAGYVLVPTSGPGFERMVGAAIRAMFRGNSCSPSMAEDGIRAALSAAKGDAR